MSQDLFGPVLKVAMKVCPDAEYHPTRWIRPIL